MTYIEPKIDWTDNEAPVGSDFNRIEGNAKANYEAIITEAGIRKNDDDVLQANIDAECNALQANIDAEYNGRVESDNILNSSKQPMPSISTNKYEVDYPIGTIVLVHAIGIYSSINNNAIMDVYNYGTEYLLYPNEYKLTGEWGVRGRATNELTTGARTLILMQRIS